MMGVGFSSVGNAPAPADPAAAKPAAPPFEEPAEPACDEPADPASDGDPAAPPDGGAPAFPLLPADPDEPATDGEPAEPPPEEPALPAVGAPAVPAVDEPAAPLLPPAAALGGAGGSSEQARTAASVRTRPRRGTGAFGVFILSFPARQGWDRRSDRSRGCRCRRAVCCRGLGTGRARPCRRRGGGGLDWLGSSGPIRRPCR